MLLYLSVKQTRTKYAGIFRRSAKMLAKASMRNTNFKKYAGLFRRPLNVANRIRLRRATSNAHVFNKISYAGISKRSQRGGLENLQSRFFANAQNPLLRLMFSPFGRSRKLFLLKLFLKNSQI